MTNAEIAEICQSAALELRELIEAVNKSTPLDEGFHDFQTCGDLMNIVRHLTAAPAQAEPSNQPAQRNPECGCRKCNTVEYQATHFIVCEHCGNKRCPHASNHRYACTNSNEPGQAGSVY